MGADTLTPPVSPHRLVPRLDDAQRVVVKVGSALLVDSAAGTLNTNWLASFIADIAAMKAAGQDVIIVSSGAIALGRTRLNLGSGALRLEEKQASAAAGQAQLTQAYDTALTPYSIPTAQALLTLSNTENRRQWLNARSTLDTLLRLGAVPIINENDTVTTDEIRYGDNDRLAARVAQMVGADVLVLLSDIDGLYTADPRSTPNAEHLAVIEDITPDILKMGAGANSAAGVGTGGMATKLIAAQIAVGAGCHMVICRGDVLSPISRIDNGAKTTWFIAKDNPALARKQWISGALSSPGTITLDAGAVNAVRAGGSLLPAGIAGINGEFFKGDLVTLVTTDNIVMARGLARYPAEDALKIAGRQSGDIEVVLGYSSGDVFIHRDDMVMVS